MPELVRRDVVAEAGRCNHPIPCLAFIFDRPTVPGDDSGGGYMNDFFAREFWRFVTVQDEVKKLALTAIDYPPMQDPASFNLDAVKKQIDAAIKNQPGN